jgi:hypothetical protein
MWTMGGDLHGDDRGFSSWLLGSVARSYHRWRFTITSSESSDAQRFPADAEHWVECEARAVERDFSVAG